MPSKRRNNGRKKMNCGHTRPVSCSHCARMVPKDKAINKFSVKDIIEASAREDVSAVQVYKNFVIPKVYQKLSYCVACAIHMRLVRSRSAEDRRIRNVRKPIEKKEKDLKKGEEAKDEKIAE